MQRLACKLRFMLMKQSNNNVVLSSLLRAEAASCRRDRQRSNLVAPVGLLRHGVYTERSEYAPRNDNQDGHEVKAS